ncbi:hypothetical protein ZOSMA_111G00030 [Zostera marina]|uniref:Inner centromere protein ARK-binding domain-containing protein n=1 Tax=Zostera marina TaxID=29655 RepID=A0A0K9Q572_ZOSMR|nr:hypothetical protein ZOSMA_111G00030 [Zostera marina]
MWCSQKQSTVSRSSTESEFRAITSAVADIDWVVPESIDKKQERLTSFHKTVPEHGNPHILNDAVPLVFCKPSSKHEYSSSSDHKEAIENRISCRSVSTLQDGQEEEGINGVTGGVYNSKGHRDSVADVDLLIGHIPNRKSSVLSGHSYVAQSRLSLKENNFSPRIGDAPSIMQTVVSPIEREEVKDVVAGNNNVVINIKNNDKPHKSSASETDFYSCDSDKVTQLHTVDQFIPLNLSPDFENFCFGDSDQDNSNIAKKSCNTEPYHLFYTSHISHSTPAKHLDYLSFLGSLDFNDNETNQYSCINESNIPLLRQSFSEEPVFKKFRSSLDIISPFNFQADSNSSSRKCSTSKKSVNLEHICFPIDENACTTGEDVLVEPGKNAEEGEREKTSKEKDIISPFNFQADSNSSSRKCSTSKKSVNLEHICFPIDENACTTGEGVLVEPGKNAEEGEREKTSKEKDIILNKLEKAFEKEKILNEQEKIAQGGLTSELVTSGNEKILGKKASYPFTSQMPSTSQIFSDRGSPDSMTTEVNMYVQVNEKKSMGDGSSLRCKPMSKKRPAPLSILKNVSRLRSGKSKFFIKSCDENKSIAITAKGFKPTNILSNISSFIPLVQQKKQAVAIQTVKREIKVKSLEAAEAVRRNEERKEKERKMKKEASKLEKLRLDQEKVKQREINEKKKGEERKKELELNARKRQREEDQKNDVKKKKFRCLQEKSRQYKQQNKMHVEDKGLQHNATEVNVKLAAKKNQELQPYEMTPFHDSDLEEENNKSQRIKAIPIWARKETLNKILQSQRHMDPTIIFKRKHAFGLETGYL